jgi:hypothetical protein
MGLPSLESLTIMLLSIMTRFAPEHKYAEAICEGVITYISSLSECDASAIVLFFQTISKTDCVPELYPDLCFKANENVGLGQFISFLSIILPDYIVTRLSYNNILYPISKMHSDCPRDGTNPRPHICCCDCDRCEVYSSAKSLTTFKPDFHLPCDGYLNFTDVDEIVVSHAPYNECISIVIIKLEKDVTKGDLWWTLNKNGKIITGGKFKVVVDGIPAISPHTTCKKTQAFDLSTTLWNVGLIPYARVHLLKWWTPPDVDSQFRLLSRQYRDVVWNSLLAFERYEKTEMFPYCEVPIEIWMLIFGFMKRDVAF